MWFGMDDYLKKNMFLSKYMQFNLDQFLDIQNAICHSFTNINIKQTRQNNKFDAK